MFRVRLDKNFLKNPSLVVRMNEKYTCFSTAAPLLVSLLMSKVRTLQPGSGTSQFMSVLLMVSPDWGVIIITFLRMFRVDCSY